MGQVCQSWATHFKLVTHPPAHLPLPLLPRPPPPTAHLRPPLELPPAAGAAVYDLSCPHPCLQAHWDVAVTMLLTRHLLPDAGTLQLPSTNRARGLGGGPRAWADSWQQLLLLLGGHGRGRAPQGHARMLRMLPHKSLMLPRSSHRVAPLPSLEPCCCSCGPAAVTSRAAVPPGSWVARG